MSPEEDEDRRMKLYEMSRKYRRLCCVRPAAVLKLISDETPIDEDMSIRESPRIRKALNVNAGLLLLIGALIWGKLT